MRIKHKQKRFGFSELGYDEVTAVGAAKAEPKPIEWDACGWCGCTEPLDTSYSDEGHGWPFCPRCKGV